MSLTPELSARQTASLILTPAMRQSLQVLQMSQLELHNYIQEELRSNPLLEEDESHSRQDSQWRTLSLSEFQLRHGFSIHVSHSDPDTAQRHDALLSLAHREETLSDALREQIGTCVLPKLTEQIALYLVDCLDSRGYLQSPPEEISHLLCVPLFEVMQALYFLQSLSPTGVAARSLEECLTLQLVQSRHFNAHTLHIVSGCLHLLAQNKIAEIAAILHTDVATAREACQIVRQLNPIPSSGYAANDYTSYIIPDAIVECPDGHTPVVQLNDSYLPPITINQLYAQLLPTLPPGEERTYIEKKLDQGNMLLRSLVDRSKTLHRVILCIVSLQPQFFRSGSGLRPMTMKDVADQLELSISTVSRAVQGKYIICRRGTVSLRSLFTTGYGIGADADLSAETVKQKLHMLIAAEDPAHPLSDAALCKALENLNISVSRRTIAKYRDELGIFSSAKRRR